MRELLKPISTSVERKIFILKKHASTETTMEVLKISDGLLKHLNKPKSLSAIAEANNPGKSSKKVQDTFMQFANSLGFKDESAGLFKEYETKSLRPDYYKEVHTTGILLEVERGKTTQNNMDFIDFWKCHICKSANYLFLMVPKELRQNNDINSSVSKEYSRVLKRMKPFFEVGNETNVWGLHVFGY